MDENIIKTGGIIGIYSNIKIAIFIYWLFVLTTDYDARKKELFILLKILGNNSFIFNKILKDDITVCNKPGGAQRKHKGLCNHYCDLFSTTIDYIPSFHHIICTKKLKNTQKICNYLYLRFERSSYQIEKKIL